EVADCDGVGAYAVYCCADWDVSVRVRDSVAVAADCAVYGVHHVLQSWLQRGAEYAVAKVAGEQVMVSLRGYIFGYHPHGIISHGAFAAFATEALGFAQLFPGITNSLLTLDSNFRIPFYREYILALGLASVSRQSCENILSRGGVNGEGMGRAITIVVGGARESLDARPGTLRLVLKRRYGFIKMALRTGADLVPVLGFGENELYDQFSVENRPWIRRGQDLLKRTLGWTLPLFHARGVFNYDVGLVPYRRAVNVVVGRPIEVRQNRMPSVEEVEELHERYCGELVRLWETWKDDFARGREEEMRIVRGDSISINPLPTFSSSTSAPFCSGILPPSTFQTHPIPLPDASPRPAYPHPKKIRRTAPTTGFAGCGTAPLTYRQNTRMKNLHAGAHAHAVGGTGCAADVRVLMMH
ncbi:hypothetical protein V497_05554, partial [Pseudogymnoascus sp. VKM F-4516 (FW-969)]